MELEKLIGDNQFVGIICEKVINLIPLQKKVLFKVFNLYSKNELDELNQLAEFILNLVGDDIEKYIRSYEWMLNIFKEELFYFLKNKKYRISNFEEAYEKIYSNEEYMKKYLQGLLISQILWPNHAKSFLFFNKFLILNKQKFNYLEIGPGHGLYLSLAAKCKLCNSIEAWDISDESIRQTKIALERNNIKRSIIFKNKSITDIQENPYQKYDLIVISEVLEHLENPKIALQNCYNLLSNRGIVYISFPINSPAPDHIFLLKSIHEVKDLIIDSGLQILDFNSFPSGGYNLKKAIELEASITCVVTAKK